MTDFYPIEAKGQNEAIRRLRTELLLVLLDHDSPANVLRGAELVLGLSDGQIELFKSTRATTLRDHAAMHSRERLQALQHSPRGQDYDKPAVFRELCTALTDLFPDIEALPDDEVRDHPTTPELVRYVVRAAHAFRSDAAMWPNNPDDPGPNPDAHARGVARAFAACNKPGTVAKSIQLHDELIDTAHAAYTAMKSAGKPIAEAYEAGLAAAYARYRKGEKGEQDAKERKQALTVIWGVLSRPGDGLPGWPKTLPAAFLGEKRVNHPPD